MVLRARLLVSGSVQGVNFRWFVQEAAKEIGIRGWVKNLQDGDVEIECESESEAAYRRFINAIEGGGGGKGLHAISVKGIKVLKIEKGTEPKYDYFNIEY
jgi:acylphosphatase